MSSILQTMKQYIHRFRIPPTASGFEPLIRSPSVIQLSDDGRTPQSASAGQHTRKAQGKYH